MGKTLAKSNIHLRNSTTRQNSLARNIESSSAIESVWVKRDAATGRFVGRKNLSSKASRITETKRDLKTGPGFLIDDVPSCCDVIKTIFMFNQLTTSFR